jgi:hypothetical protein
MALTLDNKTLARMKEEALKERRECAYNNASDIRDDTYLIWATGRYSDAFRDNHACWDVIPTSLKGR